MQKVSISGIEGIIFAGKTRSIQGIGERETVKAFKLLEASVIFRVIF